MTEHDKELILELYNEWHDAMTKARVMELEAKRLRASVKHINKTGIARKMDVTYGVVHRIVSEAQDKQKPMDLHLRQYHRENPQSDVKISGIYDER